MSSIGSKEAKGVLSQLIQRAEGGETIRITKYGRDAVVIISAERYERLARNLMEGN
ncbi:type II toxin-antitoxin system Phd/YefM family antitoxin [Streptomyces sp. DSM 40750]|uniref:type II toxin-antitoxin system Phd/YefM family antitoxin n=1 Tax=Streptomyces sp. DSM 40750 TaxID=2801030 RepID=UPI00214AC735|nr:type II toxin-antitoxin system prevent-host-death family antitoxin [Streptomyces sp. DSM 40750]UUU23315.1 type II toxin-antitoxin system prevent-host-death family antitoxin [Streptomyces sp. DSM 40750]